jgi:hypothetical protein
VCASVQYSDYGSDVRAMRVFVDGYIQQLIVSHILCVLLCYIRVDHIYFIVLFLEDLYSVNLNMLVEYSTVFFFG